MDAQKIERLPPMPPIPEPDQHTHWDYGLGDHGTTRGYSETALIAYACEYAAQTLASKEAELVRLRAKAQELLDADAEPYPYKEAGMAAQDRWAIRIENAKRELRAAITQPPKEPT